MLHYIPVGDESFEDCCLQQLVERQYEQAHIHAADNLLIRLAHKEPFAASFTLPLVLKYNEIDLPNIDQYEIWVNEKLWSCHAGIYRKFYCLFSIQLSAKTFHLLTSLRRNYNMFIAIYTGTYLESSSTAVASAAALSGLLRSDMCTSFCCT